MNRPDLSSSRESLAQQTWAERLLSTFDLSFPERIALVSAMASVPRELFVDSGFRFRAYDDDALPIGFGQTISRPSTVARMLVEVLVQPEDRVLEVGVGSGYLAAVLNALGAEVYGFERNAQLAKAASERLSRLCKKAPVVRCADGLRGWKQFAPFRSIFISAALDEVPEALLSQLDLGGKLVAPFRVGAPSEGKGEKKRDFLHSSRFEDEQRLYVWRREGLDSFTRTDLGECRFVRAA